MRKFLIVLLLLLILTSCKDKKYQEPRLGTPIFVLNNNYENIVFYTHDDKINFTSLPSNKYMIDSIYDSKHKKIISSTYDPNDSFLGLTIFDLENKKPFYDSMNNFGPVYVVIFDEIIFTNSNMVVSLHGEGATLFGVYNYNQKQMLKEFKVKGVASKIINDGSIIYIAMNSENGYSNILTYMFDSDNVINRLLDQDVTSVPEDIAITNKTLYGIYLDELYGFGNSLRRNELVKVNKDGIYSVASLPEGVKEFVLFDQYAYVLHAPFLTKPFITRVCLIDGEFTRLNLVDNPTNLGVWENNLLVVNDRNFLFIYEDSLNNYSEFDLNTRLSVSKIKRVYE